MPFTRTRAESEPTNAELQAQLDALNERVASLEKRADGTETAEQAVLRERARLSAQHRAKATASDPWAGITARLGGRTGPGVKS